MATNQDIQVTKALVVEDNSLNLELKLEIILIVIPHSSAAAGTNHMRTVTSVDHDSHEMPRSSAAIGSFTQNKNTIIGCQNGQIIDI